MTFAVATFALFVPPFLAEDEVAFAVVFGIFIVALVTMIVIVLVWAIRRDRTGRIAWRQRQQLGDPQSGTQQNGAPQSRATQNGAPQSRTADGETPPASLP
jgi:hypothetical protein